MSNTLLGKTLFAKRAYRCFPILLMVMIFAPQTFLIAASNVPKSGQTTSYLTGDDGDLEKGISWPSPRFSDNSNGTVTDNLTNLVWLKNANCFDTGTWSEALTDALTLDSGDCGLSDSSSAGDWRVPNNRELESLIHAGVSYPAVPNSSGSGKATSGDPFSSLQLDDYWSSTTNTAVPSQALSISMKWGHTISRDKQNSTIYTLFVRDSTSGIPVADVYVTGQTICYENDGTVISCDGTGQDGDLHKGMIWPVPRFTDNGNGTVTDKLSQLVWLKNADCYGVSGWVGAITTTNLLANGSCGLTDNSVAGAWRVPNRKELMSLIYNNSYSPALSNSAGTGQWSNNDPFLNVQTTSGYWSSTTYSGATSHSWYVDIRAGIIGTDAKNNIAYIWPVRDNPLLSVLLTGGGSGTVTSSPAGISCPGTCSDFFTEHSTVTLTAQADNGSRFEGWSVSGCAKNKDCQVTMTTTKSVSATFVQNSATVASWMLLLTK